MLYIKLNSENIIVDCLSYQYKGYVPIEFSGELPLHFYSGCYKYEDGKIMRTDKECDECYDFLNN